MHTFQNSTNFIVWISLVIIKICLPLLPIVNTAIDEMLSFDIMEAIQQTPTHFVSVESKGKNEHLQLLFYVTGPIDCDS